MHGHRLRTQANGTASSKVSHCEFAEVSFWRIVRVPAAGARGSSKRLSASAWKTAVTRTAATMARTQHGQRTARRRGLTIVSRRPRRRQTTPRACRCPLAESRRRGVGSTSHARHDGRTHFAGHPPPSPPLPAENLLSGEPRGRSAEPHSSNHGQGTRHGAERASRGQRAHAGRPRSSLRMKQSRRSMLFTRPARPHCSRGVKC